MGDEIRYYVTLPFQDKEFPAPTYERAKEMAMDLHKDFYLVCIVQVETGENRYSQCVLDRIYKED